MMKSILEVQEVSKRFGETQALKDVSLSLKPGEVHALLGENGAGKSTLIKIITGIHRQDHGEILLDGDIVHIHNSIDAQRYGIAAIQQEPMIFPDLTVAENIFISHRDRGLVVNWKQMYRDAEAVLNSLGISMDVRAPARGLTLAAQQSVEIAKAISLNVRVLIMDEPTASLSAYEVERLFEITRTLREQGVAILFISHRLEEVFEIADRVTVLRDGMFISSKPVGEISTESVIRDMVGRDLDDFFAKEVARTEENLLSVNGLSRENAFEGINFDLRAGEVLGFGGLVGARRTDVGLALFGIHPADRGEIRLKGDPVRIDSPRAALRLGIAYVTEDRHGLGLSLSMPIISNITLPTLNNYLNRWGLIDRKNELKTAEDYREKLDIRAGSLTMEVGHLSGGNQQKVNLSKWINADPKVLILDEPTRGIDVSAKAEVHRIISDLAAQGVGVILISSDLPELLAMSDRVLVMREGRQMAILEGAEATQETVISAAMGQTMSAVQGEEAGS